MLKNLVETGVDLLYYCYDRVDDRQVKVSGNVVAKREVRMTQAANEDLQSLVPREQSRAEIVRHATKLEYWTRDRKIAFDVPVVEVSGTEFFEAQLTDQFGLSCGLSLILWDDARFPPDGRVWILVICHHHEVSLSSTLAITETRRSIVEVCDDIWNRSILE